MSLFGLTSTEMSSYTQPKTLFGYEVLDLIGEGAGSKIYSVTDSVTQRVYALKHVVRKADKDVRFVEQLEAEHEVGQKVNHEGLRRTFDLKINRTMLRKVTEGALVMELFDGPPLEFRVPKTTRGIIDVFIQTSKALESLHGLGYVHCDLKPNNILISNAGKVKVIDLGQAAKQGTVKTRIQGTPDYISPEQVKCAPVTFRTDVFNFGATLYWALTGTKVPTLYTAGRKKNHFLLDDQIPAPHKLNPKVPQTLSSLVMECVKTSPVKRPTGMNELTSRLEIIEHAMKRDGTV